MISIEDVTRRATARGISLGEALQELKWQRDWKSTEASPGIFRPREEANPIEDDFADSPSIRELLLFALVPVVITIAIVWWLL